MAPIKPPISAYQLHVKLHVPLRVLYVLAAECERSLCMLCSRMCDGTPIDQNRLDKDLLASDHLQPPTLVGRRTQVALTRAEKW